MRFAILGDHPDGWAAARALAASGRHELAVYQGPTPVEKLRPEWPALRRTVDLEEVLADPRVEAVIVAGKPGERLDQLRRVLQSERPALCVRPVDQKPDGAYEMNLLQGDVHQVVLPILPEALHPAVEDLRRRIDGATGSGPALRLLDVRCRGPAELLFESGEPGSRPSFPGWTLIRRLVGEVEEVVGFATGEEVAPGQVVLSQGRSTGGRLFRILDLPGRVDEPPRIEIELVSDASEPAIMSFDPSNWGEAAWRSLVECFETAVERLKTVPRAIPGAGPSFGAGDVLSWLDEVRALELDDAVRRSIERRRASTLDYQEASEDVGFKGTMTLIGCALIWLIPVLLLISAAFPQLAWLIVPVLFGFLGLQLLRWLVPAAPRSSDGNRRDGASER